MSKSKYKNWTQKQLDILLNEYGKKPTNLIAQEINKSVGSVYYILNKENIDLKLSYWSSEEIAFLKEYYPLISNNEISQKLNRSEDAIQLKAASLNLTKDSFWTSEEIGLLKQLCEAGYTYERIASELHRSRSSIHNKIIEQNLTEPIHRWTNNDLNKIKTLALSGLYTYGEIAAKICAKPKQVMGVCKYKGWNNNVKRSKSLGEDYLGVILNQLYPTYTIKEQFCVGEKLKLDFFIYELNIGYEYDGEQHSKYNKYFHQSYSDFQDSINRDRQKEILCENLGINIVRIDFTEELSIELVQQKTHQTDVGIGSLELEEAKQYGGVYSKTTIDALKYQEETKILQKIRRKEYLKSEQHKQQLNRAREYRKQKYQRLKELKDGQGD